MGRLHPAGCTTLARRKRTARNLGGPTFLLGKERQHGEPDKNLRRATCLRTHELPAERQRTSVRVEVGERQGETGAIFAEGNEGVGGPRRSVDVGDGVAPGPGRAKAARVDVNFRREP